MIALENLYDYRRVAEAVGNQVGVDGLQAEVLPEDKVHVVKEYHKGTDEAGEIYSTGH